LLLVLAEGVCKTLEAFAPLVEMREPYVHLVIAETREVRFHGAGIIGTLLFVIKRTVRRQ